MINLFVVSAISDIVSGSTGMVELVKGYLGTELDVTQYGLNILKA
ncbi:hypothetical protein [Candidatus Hodarchaeum mangrovi]